MTAPSIRLADAIKSEATAYARSVGVSLNALVAIAVRDYLDARKSKLPLPTAAASPALAGEPARTDAGHAPSSGQKTDLAWRTAAAKLGRNAACPCGSGKKVKQCHGGAA